MTRKDLELWLAFGEPRACAFCRRDARGAFAFTVVDERLRRYDYCSKAHADADADRRIKEATTWA